MARDRPRKTSIANTTDAGVRKPQFNKKSDTISRIGQNLAISSVNTGDGKTGVRSNVRTPSPAAMASGGIQSGKTPVTPRDEEDQSKQDGTSVVPTPTAANVTTSHTWASMVGGSISVPDKIVQSSNGFSALDGPGGLCAEGIEDMEIELCREENSVGIPSQHQLYK
ncbi:hypothetical protein HAX54_018037 [Datura stramonium]|uniref:Uncharacterized protein n=1 Tax=Datura stramonium TaxID=4076 RepID=A0ABS8Y3H2_DATST|nr:hypothetical protein [Datura stramonium]